MLEIAEAVLNLMPITKPTNSLNCTKYPRNSRPQKTEQLFRRDAFKRVKILQFSKNAFEEFNAQISFSNAVERLFFFRKYIWKSRRSELSCLTFQNVCCETRIKKLC